MNNPRRTVVRMEEKCVRVVKTTERSFDFRHIGLHRRCKLLVGRRVPELGDVASEPSAEIQVPGL